MNRGRRGTASEDRWSGGRPGLVHLMQDNNLCSNPNDVQQGKTTMHEIGHNLNLVHADGGVMAQGCWGNNFNFDYTADSWNKIDFGGGSYGISITEHT